LDENAMHTVFARACDDDYTQLDPAKLSRFAREWYKTNESGKTPDGVSEKPKVENLPDGDSPADPVQYFTAVSPRKLLSDMSGGLVSDADLRIVERLIDEVELDKGVVNVLLAYTLKINDGNMPSFAYYQKIAMAWKRNQITTVEIAMDYVRHLNAEYLRNQDPAGSKKGGKSEKGAKPEVKIDWLDEYINTLK